MLNGSTTDGQSTGWRNTAEEQAGATADTGTADASTDTQDDSTEN